MLGYCAISQNLTPFQPCRLLAVKPRLEINRSSDTTIERIGWVPPPYGFVKINTDASVRNDSTAGYGGLCRDIRGACLVGFFGFLGNGFQPGTWSVVRAELRAILEGLRIARAMGLRFVIVESDCKIAVDMIDSGDDIHIHRSKVNDDVNLIVRECRTLLSAGGCYHIQHHKREGNFCADRLAKLGVESDQERRVFNIPPPELIPLLRADCMGVSYVRGTRL